MAGHLETHMWGLANNPDVAIGAAPLLTEHESAQLLVEWNETTSHRPTLG